MYWDILDISIGGIVPICLISLVFDMTLICGMSKSEVLSRKEYVHFTLKGSLSSMMLVENGSTIVLL